MFVYKQTFDSFDSCSSFIFVFRDLRDFLLKSRESRDSMYPQVSRLDILSRERGRRDIDIVNHVGRAVYGSSDTAIACRPVPFQRCEEKELKGKRKRDIHRARAFCEEESCDTAARILAARAPVFPFRSLRTSEPSWVISVFKIRSQYVANVCKA